MGVVPAVSFLVVFFIAPFVILAIYSFLTFNTRGVIVAGPSLEGYVKILRDPFMWWIFGRTMAIAFGVTALCLLFGYPLAYVFTRITSSFWKTTVILCVAAPLLTSTLVRTFAWLVILGRQGILNYVLTGLGILKEPIGILFTVQAVMIAMFQVLLPFMIVPLISTLQAVPRDVGNAATNLGATQWHVFWEITVPQNLPGVFAGVSLVFMLAYTMFVVPTLMGGSTFGVASIFIWDNVNILAWDTASQVASLLLITSLAVVTGLNMIFRRVAPWQYLHA